MKYLNQGRDYNHNRTNGLEFSDHNDAEKLSAGVAIRHALPEGANWVLLSPTGVVYVLFGDASVTAAVPSTTITDGSASVPNLGLIRMPAGATHLSLISPADCVVTLSFWM